MGKFYAVRKGKTPGVYTTWNECKLNVFGFPGAEYKSFDTKEEADAFMNEEQLNNDEIDFSTLGPYAYVDGSFNNKTKTYGYGGFLMNGEEKYILQGSGNDTDKVSMRNITGEVMGSMAAIAKAIELELDKISIFYDYMGIEMWAKGLWDRGNPFTEEYHQYVKSVKDKISIHFIKVKGHTGNEGNEEADKLAKQAVGL